MSRTPLAISACVLGALMSTAPAARAQAETLTASATLKTASGASASAPLTVVIEKFASDAERDELMEAVKKGGTSAAKALLAGRRDAGSVQLGARKTPIKYAYARPLGGGRLVTVVTAEPIAFVGAGLPGAPPKAGYDLGLVMLEVSEASNGQGELVPAAKVRVSEQGAIVTEDYGSEVVRLSNITKK
jgi:hypothetical protein